MAYNSRRVGVFIREFFRSFTNTGSLFPSSRALALEITSRLVERPDRVLRILECGPGTGSFTDSIVRTLRPGDTFDLVEINPAFARELRRRFESESAWKHANDWSTIHEVSLQQFTPPERYDFIISGIPHINFPPPVVAEILACYERLLKPGGCLSYFEYAYIRRMRSLATLGWDRSRIANVDALMNAHLARHSSRRATVLRNFPPAWVRHLTAPA